VAKRKQRQVKPTKPTYDLDIIIPVYGQPDLLAKCLEALPEACGPIRAHTILVDDCGPEQDKLTEVYRSLNGTSRLVRNRQNSGFAKTVNAGVSAGTSPYILLLNSDVILQPGAVPAMVSEFDDPAVGVVGCKLLFADSRWDHINKREMMGTVQHAGIAVNIRGQLYHVNLGWEADHPKVSKRREMQAVTGACLMTRREVWRGILAEYKKFGDPTGGALNEVYERGTFEDVELCLAAKAHGYKVIYTPHAVGYHYVGASVTQNSGQFPMNRNQMIFNARCGHLLQWDEYKYL